jgi:23S rRNA (cytosine1962-C5)-methyltransferase
MKHWVSEFSAFPNSAKTIGSPYKMLKTSNFEYELIDCGNGSRIEKFGDVLIDRPCPQAMWALKLRETEAPVFFERFNNQARWKGSEKLNDTWTLKVGDTVQAELRFSQNGQVGIFPEQFTNWQWIEEKIKKNKVRGLKILNGFAYTGMSTLFASTKNTEVCHVDGAKSSIGWAKRNAELSGLSENKIRWICDDVLQFMAREVRRRQKYDGIILDPPAFGRGAKKDWKIERDLPELMKLVGKLLTDKPSFVILTCHAPKYFSPEDLAVLLEKIPQFVGKKAEKLFLEIPSTRGNALPSSFGARISF